MDVVFLDHTLQFFVLAANLLQVLRVEPLLGEVDKDAPSPILQLRWVVHFLNLDSD